MINIYNHQQVDTDLMRAASENPATFVNKDIRKINILCTIKTPNEIEDMN